MSRQHVTAQQRRELLVQRHLLGGTGESVREVSGALIAVHATDPATPFLSVLARTQNVGLVDIASEMYDQQQLVRWLSMRRTVFVLDRDLVPTIQAAVSDPLASTLRKRLVTLLEKNGALPSNTDVPSWVASVEDGVRVAVREIDEATGAQLSAAEPRLRTVIPPRVPSESRQTLTSPLLAMMSAAGEIVRASPVGEWTTRQHHWQSVDKWWPDGMPKLNPAEAQAALAERWLESYGPATIDDLQWWTGWSKTTTRAAIATLATTEVDLDGVEGIDILRAGGEHDLAVEPEPSAALLPSLDSTAMGWKHRHWYSPIDTSGLYDNRGNIGPSVWWNGSIVGVWSSTPQGVRTRLLDDVGQVAVEAIAAAASSLETKLGGTVVVPSIRTPIERDLSQAA